jgi:hypothetical protein
MISFMQASLLQSSDSFMFWDAMSCSTTAWLITSYLLVRVMALEKMLEIRAGLAGLHALAGHKVLDKYRGPFVRREHPSARGEDEAEKYERYYYPDSHDALHL